jgi:hypothetical protein
LAIVMTPTLHQRTRNEFMLKHRQTYLTFATINFRYNTLFSRTQEWNLWYSTKSIWLKNFKSDISVMLIIDCTEVTMVMPSSLVRKSQTYSDYKSANTLKGIVGVNSRGGIMSVSTSFLLSNFQDPVITSS